MNLSALLAELETKSHRDRVARMIALGRQAAAGDAEASGQIAELGRSADAYQRQLAIFSVHGSEDGARLAAGTADPSRTLRRASWRRLVRFCQDEQLLAEALDGVSHLPTLRRAIARLHRAGQLGPIDRFLEPRLAATEVETAYLELLPFGSVELVCRHFALFDNHAWDSLWGRLAQQHPDLAAELWLARLDGKLGLTWPQRNTAFSVLRSLAHTKPDAALRLLRVLLPLGEKSDWQRQQHHPHELVVARPAEVFDLLREHLLGLPPNHTWPRLFSGWNFAKLGQKLGGERLAWLLHYAPEALPDGDDGIRFFHRLGEDDRRVFLEAFLNAKPRRWGAFLFRYLSPAEKRRAQAFAAWVTATVDRDGLIDPDQIAFLPRDLREQETRRHLAHPALALDSQRRLVYARFLSFDEAATTLATFLGHPEGAERALAVRHLLGTLRHDRAAVPAALEFLRARKFEQDPYRQAACDTLADLPPGVFTASHLPALEILLRDAREAADLSAGTTAALERLLCRLLRVDAPWAAARLVELWTTRGGSMLGNLGQLVLPGHQPALAAALAPLCQTLLRRESASSLLHFARSFGRRLNGLPPLQAALESLATELPFVGVAGQALGLLRRHDGPRFARLVPALLAKDKSFILLGETARHLSLSRQDLLPPLLAARAMEGRFATGNTQWVIDFNQGFSLWTSGQQNLYAKQLLALLADPERDTLTLRFAIFRLSRLPFFDPQPYLGYAADPRQTVREMVVRSLPWLDAGQGLPTLIEALDDDRARWAIYALRKACAEMRREETLRHLRAAPLRKITVAKEILRLLGDFGGEEGFRELVRLEAGELHRDVRVALLRALFGHLKREETWRIFDRAAKNEDWIVATKLAEMPLQQMPADAEEKLIAILVQLFARPEPEARKEMLQKARSLPLADHQRRFFAALRQHLATAEPEEGALALGAILLRMKKEDGPEIAAQLAPFIQRRHHWQKFFPALLGYGFYWTRGTRQGLFVSLLPALREDLPSLPQLVRMAAEVDDPEDWVKRLAELADKDLLYREVWDSALEAVSSFRLPELLEPQFRHQKNPQLRRLGLAVLLRQAAQKEGWTEANRQKLQLYQKDRSPEVWAPATLILPPEPTET